MFTTFHFRSYHEPQFAYQDNPSLAMSDKRLVDRGPLNDPNTAIDYT